MDFTVRIVDGSGRGITGMRQIFSCDNSNECGRALIAAAIDACNKVGRLEGEILRLFIGSSDFCIAEFWFGYWFDLVKLTEQVIGLEKCKEAFDGHTETYNDVLRLLRRRQAECARDLANKVIAITDNLDDAKFDAWRRCYPIKLWRTYERGVDEDEIDTGFHIELGEAGDDLVVLYRTATRIQIFYLQPGDDLDLQGELIGLYPAIHFNGLNSVFAAMEPAHAMAGWFIQEMELT